MEKLKKFIFGTLLVFGLAFGIATVISMAEQATVDGIDYTFSVDATTNTANITKVDPHDKTECNIPSELSGYSVKSIGNTSAESMEDIFGINSTDMPFFNCNNLISVTIPDGVESIGSFTFYECQNLESVVIPNTVTSINYMAIYDCNSMQSITVPHCITSIGAGSFSTCENLESIFIPNGAIINPLDDGTGGSLNTIVPENTIVYKYAVLADQTGAPAGKTLVKISSKEQGSGTSVACGAMGENYVIRSVEASGVTLTHSCKSSPFDVTIDGTLWTCTILQENGVNANNVSIKPKNKNTISGDVTIPSIISVSSDTCDLDLTVTKIDDEAFLRCYGLANITIPEIVTEIGSSAFENCSGLGSITISENVITIGDSAFKSCGGLTNIIISNGVKFIGNSVFESCSTLKNLTIPASVNTIGTNTFKSCFNLTDVFIEENDQGNIVDISSTSIRSGVNIWHYDVLQDQAGASQGKTLVEIVSVGKSSGYDSLPTTVACDAMGDNYLISPSEESGITLTHSLPLTHEVEVAATCATAGHIDGYTCDACGKHFGDENGETEIEENSWVIPALEHNWGNATYAWTQENGAWNCTATRVCGNNSSHVETETVTATSEVKTAATCTTDGTTTYTAEFANEIFATQTKDVDDISAIGHNSRNKNVHSNI